jgi:hypothetical protein
MFPCAAAGPLVAAGTREGRGAPFGVDDANLSLVAAVVGFGQAPHDLLRGEALSE